jgi:hypothetical protein
MGKAKAKESELNPRQSASAYAFETLQNFIDRHLVEGHDVRIFLDPNRNCYAIFCAACDPRMGDAMETRH